MPRSLARPLTQRLIDSTPLPSSGSVTLRDHEQRGLALRIWPAGTRSWSFEYRSPVTGKNCRLGLPAGSLSEARVAAKSHRALVALGRDPALEAHSDLEERREAHAKVVSVAAALDDYEAAVTMNAAKAASRRKRVRVLRRALEGFEARAVASIGRGELLKRLDTIQSDAGDVSRNRAQSRAAAFSWVVPRARDHRHASRLDRVRRGVREVARDRVLSDDELKALLLCDRRRVDLLGASCACCCTRAMRRGEAAALASPRSRLRCAHDHRPRGGVEDARRAAPFRWRRQSSRCFAPEPKGWRTRIMCSATAASFRSPFSGFSKAFATTGVALAGRNQALVSARSIRRTACASRLHEGVGADADNLVAVDALGGRGFARASHRRSRRREWFRSLEDNRAAAGCAGGLERHACCAYAR